MNENPASTSRAEARRSVRGLGRMACVAALASALLLSRGTAAFAHGQDDIRVETVDYFYYEGLPYCVNADPDRMTHTVAHARTIGRQFGRCPEGPAYGSSYYAEPYQYGVDVRFYHAPFLGAAGTLCFDTDLILNTGRAYGVEYVFTGGIEARCNNYDAIITMDTTHSAVYPLGGQSYRAIGTRAPSVFHNYYYA